MVVYLNGPINAGKSTVSRLLEAAIPRCVRIEVDDLPAPEGVALDELIAPLLADAAALAGEWHERGFHVIVVWPIGEADHAAFVKRMASAGAEVFTFTLAPQMEVALTNRGGRELTEWERKRIAFHYASGIAAPPFGEVIDNSEESPERTCERILARLREFGAL